MLAALWVALPATPTVPPGARADTERVPDAGPTEHPTPAVAHHLPPDVRIPPDFPENQSRIAFFDDFSWQTFLALNWPAVDGKRDVPDLAKKLGDESPAVVWGTWKAAYEVFQPNGAAPGAWESFQAISPSRNIKDADAGKFKQLVAFSRFGSVLEDTEAFGFGNPVGALVAQNRTFVRYEMRLNKPQFNYIRGDPKNPKTALYLGKNLPAEDAPPLTFPTGSIVVKAAWREFKLPKEQELLKRYYHVDAVLVDRVTRESVKKTMGLVGLHIVCKTASRPQWIWSTFEHVDNVKVGPNAPVGMAPTFNNPKEPQDGPGVNILHPRITPKNPPEMDPQPVQVVRMNPIRASTQRTNSLYQNHALVKDTVWKYYELVGTQWPTRPKEAGLGAPEPMNKVANVTLETGTGFQMISCMYCHESARQTDLMWMLPVRSYQSSEKNLSRVVEALKKAQGK